MAIAHPSSRSDAWRSLGHPRQTPRSTAVESALGRLPQLPFAAHWSPSFTGTITTMVAAGRKVSRGTPGRTTPPRGVFPLDWLASRVRLGQANATRARTAHPATAERSPTAMPWRERPFEMAAWPAKPAASDVVASRLLVMETAAGIEHRPSLCASRHLRGSDDAMPLRWTLFACPVNELADDGRAHDRSAGSPLLVERMTNRPLDILGRPAILAKR